jgi:hypothetical protein
MVRRKKLIILWSVAGGAVVVCAAVLLVLSQSETTYTPGQGVEGITRKLERELPSDHPQIVFRDVAAQAGVHFQHFQGVRSTQLPEDMGSGAAWGDYDNDGWEDLFLCNIAGPVSEEGSAPRARNRLFHNDGDGTFTDVTDEAGVGDSITAMGAAWGDFDSDGFLDLVVTGFGNLHLYRNNGNGTLSDVTRVAGMDSFEGFWTGASWSDYDRDGKIDLYVSAYVQYEYRPEDAERGTLQYQAVVPYTLNPSSYSPERNLLFHNNGDGTFTEQAEAAGVENASGRSLSASWTDFDDDGWPDLYVANDVSDNAMYRNLGNGRFDDVSHGAWVADYRGAMGLAVGDWDRDGDQDLFVSHWLAQENALYSNLKFAFDTASVPDGEMRFMDVADMVGLGQIALDYIGWGAFFFDYDNDGRLDLFLVNGSTFQDPDDTSRLIPMRDQLFWNAGSDRGFYDVGAVSGEVFDQKHVARGAAFADYDHDGDLDVVVVNHGSAAHLLRNDGGNANRWISVAARSPSGNRFAIGAKVTIEAGGQTQQIQIGSQPSYLSQNPLRAHFGLGSAERVDRLVVIFPSGKRVEKTDIETNQTIEVREDEG